MSCDQKVEEKGLFFDLEVLSSELLGKEHEALSSRSAELGNWGTDEKLWLSLRQQGSVPRGPTSHVLGHSSKRRASFSVCSAEIDSLLAEDDPKTSLCQHQVLEGHWPICHPSDLPGTIQHF